VVAQELHWAIGAPGSGWVLVVPAGREFESSVPRLLHWALSPHDPRFLKAAAVHDTLLERGHRRAFADSQWYEAALFDGAPRWKARAAYLAMVLRRFTGA
jgi:hypothetical protein